MKEFRVNKSHHQGTLLKDLEAAGFDLSGANQIGSMSTSGNDIEIVFDNDLPPDKAILLEKILNDHTGAIPYDEKRQNEYPDIFEQLDMMYHDFDNWKKEIKKIKDKYPKP